MISNSHGLKSRTDKQTTVKYGVLQPHVLSVRTSVRIYFCHNVNLTGHVYGLLICAVHTYEELPGSESRAQQAET